MSTRTPILPAIVLASAVAAAAAPSPVTLVICAPGYPGTTKEAQPSMDALAKAVAKAAGWPPARFAAEYHETEEAGGAPPKAETPSLAMVPPSFYLAPLGDLELDPPGQAGGQSGEGGATTETRREEKT